eukprot:UN17024
MKTYFFSTHAFRFICNLCSFFSTYASALFLACFSLEDHLDEF